MRRARARNPSTIASRRVVGVLLDIAFGQVAAPDPRRGFADAEVDGDRDFGLAEILAQPFEIASDGRAFSENIGGAEANDDFAWLDALIEALANRHDDSAPVWVRAVHGGFHQGRVGD